MLLNAGVPMIVPSIIVMVIALVPIILLEALCYYLTLETTIWNSIKSSLIANIFSTFIGIPLTWMFLVLVKFLTDKGEIYRLDSKPPLLKFLILLWESPWISIGKRNSLRWMIYASGLILIIPFFLASWVSEYWIISYFLADNSLTTINKAVRNANLFSYFLLAIYGLWLLMKEQRRLWKALSKKSNKLWQKPSYRITF